MYARAIEVYATEKCARTFAEDLSLHLHFGFVHSTPDYFIMGRPVLKAAPIEQIVNCRHIFTGITCDCWHVYLACGDIARAWEVLPWPLPWISFERKNELRFHELERIREHCLA